MFNAQDMTTDSTF